MGKHRNAKQEAEIVEFMREHQEIARGFSKGDRVVQDELWSRLERKLNSAGPPKKEKGEWKKTWIDWKGNIRRKLSHNKSEVRMTGGGKFNKLVLTRVEEEIAIICGLYRAVNGIENTKSYGVLPINEENVDVVKNSTPSPGSSSGSSSAPTSPRVSPKRSPQRTPQQSPDTPVAKKRRFDVSLNSLMKKETDHLKDISSELNKISNDKEGLGKELKRVNDKLDSLNEKFDIVIGLKRQKLEEVKKDRQERKRHNKLVEQHNREIQVHNKEIEKYNYQGLKNEVQRLNLKLRAVDLEEKKMSV